MNSSNFHVIIRYYYCDGQNHQYVFYVSFKFDFKNINEIYIQESYQNWWKRLLSYKI